MENIGVCPFGGACHLNCMLLLTSSNAVCGPINEGEANCAIAVLASHIASKEHSGGNYLMKTISLEQSREATGPYKVGIELLGVKQDN